MDKKKREDYCTHACLILRDKVVLLSQKVGNYPCRSSFEGGRNNNFLCENRDRTLFSRSWSASCISFMYIRILLKCIHNYCNTWAHTTNFSAKRCSIIYNYVLSSLITEYMGRCCKIIPSNRMKVHPQFKLKFDQLTKRQLMPTTTACDDTDCIASSKLYSNRCFPWNV